MTNSSELTVKQSADLDFVGDPEAFKHMLNVAKYFSQAHIVPDAFKNKPHNCLIALLMARSLKVDPWQCLNNVHVIHGKASLSASFLIGLANSRGPFKGVITWKSSGKGLALVVTAKAVIKETNETVEVSVSMEQAQAAGWTKNPVYKTIPEQMLRYRSATWLIRLYAPEVMGAYQTTDEIIDITPENDVQVGASKMTQRQNDEIMSEGDRKINEINNLIQAEEVSVSNISESMNQDPETSEANNIF
tara:strand:- start:2164 stop:2904 length:741 start_codon:yes stop_codon:yes gene_type:complete